eukprot:comp6578_c1_seq1/m.2356 comp6578_c1_seq1/g.2356  ORF comp6578_c1_seq1/g.2356 comp6578_c1_seq1/m.2356 type:complete len:281 (-) comp6578_c1_seq1:33-875(-)
MTTSAPLPFTSTLLSPAPPTHRKGSLPLLHRLLTTGSFVTPPTPPTTPRTRPRARSATDLSSLARLFANRILGTRRSRFVPVWLPSSPHSDAAHTLALSLLSAAGHPSVRRSPSADCVLGTATSSALTPTQTLAFVGSLRKFLQKEHCEEMLDFLLAVHSYHLAPTRQAREHILHTFVLEGAAKQVSLDEHHVVLVCRLVAGTESHTSLHTHFHDRAEKTPKFFISDSIDHVPAWDQEGALCKGDNISCVFDECAEHVLGLLANDTLGRFMQTWDSECKN